VIAPGVEHDLKQAERLEWWTLGAMATVLAVMTAAAGGSEAFKNALFEDWLSLIPAIVFLVAARLERWEPTRRFPFGFGRANSLAFLIAAVALASVGASLMVESVKTLVSAEHPSVEPVRLFGREIWSGWLMIAALAYSVVPPFILGQLKLPVARRLHDKVLHTDALMQKADWQTGLAGIVGVIGIAFGLWWMDAVAATFIAFSILHDGIKSLRTATAELIDGFPRKLENDEPAEDAVAVRDWLRDQFPEAEIMIRETGRYMHAVVTGADRPEGWEFKP
jgi:cobalt-zinc-cadmium efflux system protein